MIKQLLDYSSFLRCSTKLRLSSAAVIKLQSCRQLSRCPKHDTCLRNTSFIIPISRQRRQFFCCSATVCTSNSEKTGPSPSEKQHELKKKKEAKRQERLDKQRIRQEAANLKNAQVRYTQRTKEGSKKDISCSLPDAYSSEYVEAAWYDWWVKEGFFRPEYNDKPERAITAASLDRFVICLPPPNITGTLHLGHAMGNAVEDVIVRWHRMCGHVTLWNPGCDHAGIATQSVVEQKLWRERKLSRHDLGRDKFVDEVLRWKDEKIHKIYDQMKRMGLSLDWSRVCFTMDPKLNRAVNEAFIRLFESGAIYRSKRLVNWSCSLRSAISDIEVETLPINGKTLLSIPGYEKSVPFGLLNSFAYPVEGSVDEIVVATTRLETMLGDVAVAVNPADARYVHLHGRHLRHPIDNSRIIPVVTDDSVDMAFGSGAVKITPSHDPSDFELAKRHSLPHMNILSDDGTLINVPSPFKGMKRFDARTLVQKTLENLGLFRGQQEHSMVVPVCSRSKDVIEYLLKDQWFVECKDMAQRAIEAVKSNRLTLIPQHYEKQWTDWLQATGDWCISRQLWWGHRIPVYKVQRHRSTLDSEVWVAAHNEQEALRKAAVKVNLPVEQLTVHQDEDVLDTWFSSALFPFSIFGWPDQTQDLAKFYPTDLLETASDIMFFWVARMVMLGEKLTGQLPFKQVLFHSILRDAQGRKMSKSLGNVIDPMHVINGVTLPELVNAVETSNLSAAEIDKAKQGLHADYPLGIAQCGADALRFTMCSYDFTAHVVNVDVDHIKASRHFCNKIWQAFRFFTLNTDSDFQPIAIGQLRDSLSATDQWILSRLSTLVNSCDVGFKSYNLTQVTRSLHTFWWAELCDVYVEYLKVVMSTQSHDEIVKSKSVLYLCINTGLRLLSPFMPFLTEELYQRLPCENRAPSVMVSSYPVPSEFPYVKTQVERDMQLVRDIVAELLLLRKDLNLTKEKAQVFIKSDDDSVRQAVNQHLIALLTLSRCKTVTLLDQCDDAVLRKCLSLPTLNGSAVLYVNLQGVIDSQRAQSQIAKQIQKLEQEVNKLQKIVAIDNRESLSNGTKIEALKSNINRLSNLAQSVDKVT